MIITQNLKMTIYLRSTTSILILVKLLRVQIEGNKLRTNNKNTNYLLAVNFNFIQDRLAVILNVTRRFNTRDIIMPYCLSEQKVHKVLRGRSV